MGVKMERLKDAIKILLFITISFSLLFFTIKISSYIDSKSDKPKEKETVWLIPALKDKWNFLYLDDIDVKNDRYPVIYLRSGYKPILEKKDIVTVGWKYELINTADKRFNMTVIMKFVDRDGFVIATSTANDYARERHYLL
jgi:NADH:ubiquinone oxidoreductase subunit 3 (subunit A)